MYPYLYSLGGSNSFQKLYFNAIEYLNLNSLTSWTLIETESFPKMNELGAIQINPTQILIFGGNRENQSQFMFNPQTQSWILERVNKMHRLVRGEEMVLADRFYHNDCFLYRNKVYALGKNYMHVMDLTDSGWEMKEVFENSFDFTCSLKYASLMAEMSKNRIERVQYT